MVENSRSGSDNGKHQNLIGVWMININLHIFLKQGNKHPTKKKKNVIEVFHNFITFSSKQSRTHCKVVTVYVDVFVKGLPWDKQLLRNRIGEDVPRKATRREAPKQQPPMLTGDGPLGTRFQQRCAFGELDFLKNATKWVSMTAFAGFK